MSQHSCPGIPAALVAGELDDRMELNTMLVAVIDSAMFVPASTVKNELVLPFWMNSGLTVALLVVAAWTATAMNRIAMLNMHRIMCMDRRVVC